MNFEGTHSVQSRGKGADSGKTEWNIGNGIQVTQLPKGAKECQCHGQRKGGI